MTKILIILFVITTAVIIIPNPLHYHFPSLVQTYINFQSKSNKGVLDLEELEIAMDNPLRCAQNSDCMIIPCGKAPNCNSIPINKEFYSQNQENLPIDFICPDSEENACTDKYFLDMFAACEENTCVLQRLFNSQTIND